MKEYLTTNIEVFNAGEFMREVSFLERFPDECGSETNILSRDRAVTNLLLLLIVVVVSGCVSAHEFTADEVQEALPWG